MFDGELFIIGRIKDLLIVNGRNHYPDDIELTIQEITKGRVAAVSVPDDDTEKLVAIVEIKPPGGTSEGGREPRETQATAHRGGIENATACGSSIWCWSARVRMPITTSGKIRRSACPSDTG